MTTIEAKDVTLVLDGVEISSKAILGVEVEYEEDATTYSVLKDDYHVIGVDFAKGAAVSVSVSKKKGGVYTMESHQLLKGRDAERMKRFTHDLYWRAQEREVKEGRLSRAAYLQRRIRALLALYPHVPKRGKMRRAVKRLRGKFARELAKDKRR